MDELMRRRMMMQSAGSSPASPLQFFDFLKSDGKSYINTGVVLDGSIQFDIEGVFGCIGKFRNEECLVSSYNGSRGFNVFFTGDDTSRKMSTYVGAHNYLDARGWWNNFNVKLTFDGTSSYAFYVDETSTTFSSDKGNSNSPVTLLARADAASLPAQIGTGYCGTITIKYGAGLVNQKTFRPCVFNGEAGMWCVEENQFYGNAASSGFFFVANDVNE